MKRLPLPGDMYQLPWEVGNGRVYVVERLGFLADLAPLWYIAWNKHRLYELIVVWALDGVQTEDILRWEWVNTLDIKFVKINITGTAGYKPIAFGLHVTH